MTHFLGRVRLEKLQKALGNKEKTRPWELDSAAGRPSLYWCLRFNKSAIIGNIEVLRYYVGWSHWVFLSETYPSQKNAATTVIEMINVIVNFSNPKTLMLVSINRNSVKRIQTDGGGESIGSMYQIWLMQREIIHEASIPYLPESNGRDERLDISLMDTASKLPVSLPVSKQNFWAGTVPSAFFIRNRLTSQSCEVDGTSYKALHGRHLSVFRCKASVHMPEKKRIGTFEHGAEEDTLVGYCKSDSYGILSHRSNQVIESKDVIFDEYSARVQNHEKGCINFDDIDQKCKLEHL